MPFRIQKTVPLGAAPEQEILQVKDTDPDCYKYGFFSRSGFETAGRDDVIQIELQQLYEE